MDILIEKNLKQIADVMRELLDIVKKEIKKSEELSKATKKRINLLETTGKEIG
jgi:Na+/phosphate symporter